MNTKNITVLRKIIYAVEAGGQIYGRQNYSAFAGVGANCSNEKAITIGAGQWYADEAKELLHRIQRMNPKLFKDMDNAGMEKDLLMKSWSTYAATANSSKGKCIIAIISTDLGKKCQDQYMEDQIQTYAKSIEKAYGAMPDTAMMECINILHQGGNSALKRILSKTVKPYTADKIYTTLCLDPKDPTSNQVGDYEDRQKAVISMIRKYAIENKKGETTVAVRMSNCGHDENGRYAGGKAGDQTGTEWYLRSWYAYPTGGWNYILRWKDESLGNLFADLAIEAALNDKIGYDQGTAGNSADRCTFRQQMKAVGYRPSKITKPCECDCSEGTIVLIQAVGHLKGIKELQECNATYTGNMMDYFNSAKGKKYFTVLQGRYLKDSSLAKRGDINLNTGHHVNVTVDNGSNAGKGSTTNTTTTTTGGSGYMFSVGNVQNGSKGNDVKLLQRLLKSNGFKGKDGKNLTIDGECGTNTVYAIKKYQTKKGLSVDGCAGPATWKSILLR